MISIWQYLLQLHIYTIVLGPWENNSNSVWYAIKLKIYSYTSKSRMEIIWQSFIQELISRIQISKPVRISLPVTVQVPGNVFLHVSYTGHGITSFPPFWLWMPLEIVRVWKIDLICLIIQKQMTSSGLKYGRPWKFGSQISYQWYFWFGLLVEVISILLVF